MRILTLIALTTFYVQLLAQTPTVESQQAINQLGNLTQFSTSTVVELPGNTDVDYEVSGSRFFKEDFIQGELNVYSQEKAFTQIEIIFNIYDNIVLARQRGKTVQLNNGTIKSFEIFHENEVFIFINGKELDNRLVNEFLLKQFSTEEFSVFTQFKKQQTVKSASQAYGSTRNEIIYSDKVNHYLFIDSELILIDRPKMLKDIFSELESIKIKKRKLNNISYVKSLLQNM